jgi:hypothetical protein
MPGETRNYVSAITGSSVEDWAKAGKGGKQPDRIPTSSCRQRFRAFSRSESPTAPCVTIRGWLGSTAASTFCDPTSPTGPNKFS